VRPTPSAATLPSGSTNDEELSQLWHYLAKIDSGSWSRRELRGLVLSVQQLSLQGRQAQWQLSRAQAELEKLNAELHHANTALHEANTELHKARVGLHDTASALHSVTTELHSTYASYAWRITKPLRLTADWLRKLRR
jgi:chromosome segregation ATPase